MIANWISVTVQDSEGTGFKYGLHPKVDGGTAALQMSDVSSLQGKSVRFNLQSGLRHPSIQPYSNEPVKYRSEIRMQVDSSLVDLLLAENPHNFTISEDLKHKVAGVLGVSVEQVKYVHARPSTVMAIAN